MLIKEKCYSAHSGSTFSNLFYDDLGKKAAVAFKAKYNTSIKYNSDLNEIANAWAKTGPVDWQYKPNECAYGQVGKAIWEKKPDDKFQCATVESLLKFFFPNNDSSTAKYSRIVYTCDNNQRYLEEKQVKELTEFGIGTWVKQGKGDHERGKEAGVRAWFFLFYQVPDSWRPSTQKPPPDPDATSTTTATSKTPSPKNDDEEEEDKTTKKVREYPDWWYEYDTTTTLTV